MRFSLPSYCRLSDVDLDRLRRDEDRNSSNRVARILFNLLLLAGLWGVPLYARWALLSDGEESERLAKTVLGKWWKDEDTLLEFTAEQQLRLIRKGAMIESANYRIVGDVLEIFRFKLQPGDQDLEINQQCYQICLRDDQLLITPATTGFTPHLGRSREGSVLRRVLPPWHPVSVTFQRRDER